MTAPQPVDPSERVPAPTIDFEPARPRPRHDGWTARKQIAFIEALAANIRRRGLPHRRPVPFRRPPATPRLARAR